MADDVDAPWYLQPRERIRGRRASAMKRVLSHWQESGQRERYEKYREVDAAAAQQAIGAAAGIESTR
jgi:hypothetical protein